MNNLTTIGIDIAKNVLQIYGMDQRGNQVLKKRIRRDRFLSFMANLPSCVIGMEACGGAHYLARQLTSLGFDVRLMSPRAVKKYADYQKNDHRDARACAEAVNWANMRFVPIKNKTQLHIQSIHRMRSHYVKHKTALMNMIRGLLYEQGITIKQGEAGLIDRLSELLDDRDTTLSSLDKALFSSQKEQLALITKAIKQLTQQLEQLANEDACCQQWMTIEGIGPISATGLIAKIGNGSDFRCGRELSAYLGLIPKQHSSGETRRLLRITKQGDGYLRALLIHGARSVIQSAMRRCQETDQWVKYDRHSQWIRKLFERVGWNKASVAVANKNARLVIGLLKSGTNYDPNMAHGT